MIFNLFLLFCGMFMETIAALIVLFVPLLQLAESVGIVPFLLANIAVLMLVSYFPVFSTWLPSLLMK